MKMNLGLNLLRQAYFAWLLTVVLFLAGPLVAHAQKVSDERVALVIGNSDYTFSPLTNPKNDAVGMADLLTQAGFQVSRNLNAGRADLKTAVEQFGKRLRSPSVKFAIFYYAGHGVQLDWRNYLIPVDAKVRSADDVRAQAVDVSELLRFMDEAKDKSFLVILDACRDDPFGSSYKASNKGLSQFDGPVGSLLAYSTSPGNVAMDGTGDNGLYTSHLLRELSVRNAKLEDAFKRVRLNVRLESGGRQIPWESTSLEEDIYLFKSETKKLSEAEQEALIDKEVTAWKKVKTSTDPRVLANFIREFPSGSTSELAQSRLNRILVSLSTLKGQGDGNAQVVDKGGKAGAASAAQLAAQAKQIEKAEKAAKEAEARVEELRIADEKAKQLKANEEANKLAEAKRQESFRLAAEAQLKLIQEAKAKDLQKQEELRLARKREEEQLALANAAAAKLEAERLKAFEAQKLEAARVAAEREAAAKQMAIAEEERRQEVSRLAIAQAAEAKRTQERLALAKLEADKARVLAEQEAAAKSQMAAQAARDAQARADELRIAGEKAQQAKAAEDAAKLAESKRQEAFRVAAEAQLKAMQDAKAKELQQQEALRAARVKEQEQLALAAAAAAKLEADRIKVFELQKAEAARLAAQREEEAARIAAAEAERRQEFNRLAIAQAAEATRVQDQLLVLRAEAERARLAALEEVQSAARLKQEAESTTHMAAAAGDVQFASIAPLMVLAPTPFYMGSNVFARQYNIGDEFGFRVIDGFNKSEKPLVLGVTAVDADSDRVEYNGGEYTSDMMGNITRNVRGSLDQPRQFYPAEFFIGKRWKTQFKQTRANGTAYTFKYDLKVVAKEKITVPAGTFDTYKIEARGFNVELGANLQRNIWVSPGISADIAHETLVRLRNGQIEQNDRQELVRYISGNRVAASQ